MKLGVRAVTGRDPRAAESELERSASTGEENGGCCLNVQAGRIMTEPSSRKEGFKKCRSATFSIDGYSFTIGEPDLIPPLSFTASLFLLSSLSLQLQ